MEVGRGASSLADSQSVTYSRAIRALVKSSHMSSHALTATMAPSTAPSAISYRVNCGLLIGNSSIKRRATFPGYPKARWFLIPHTKTEKQLAGVFRPSLWIMLDCPLTMQMIYSCPASCAGLAWQANHR